MKKLRSDVNDAETDAGETETNGSTSVLSAKPEKKTKSVFASNDSSDGSEEEEESKAVASANDDEENGGVLAEKSTKQSAFQEQESECDVPRLH